MTKTDEYGFEYYESLSSNAKLITNIWAFVNLNREEWNYYKPKIGMEYLIQSQDGSRYYIHKLSKHIKDEHLIKYINSSQLFCLI